MYTNTKAVMRANSTPPFLGSIREAIRVCHYNICTEQAYVAWTKRHIRLHKLRHPGSMGEAEVVEFLPHVAVVGKVTANTQNQALNALVFLYENVLEGPLGELQAVRARKPQKLPVVLTRDDIRCVLKGLQGVHWLAAGLTYGSGLRLMKAMRLRVKDLDFSYTAVVVRDGRGAKDRVVALLDDPVVPLERHLESVKNTHVLNRGGLAVVSPLGGISIAVSLRGEAQTPEPDARTVFVSLDARHCIGWLYKRGRARNRELHIFSALQSRIQDK